MYVREIAVALSVLALVVNESHFEGQCTRRANEFQALLEQMSTCALDNGAMLKTAFAFVEDSIASGVVPHVWRFSESILTKLPERTMPANYVGQVPNAVFSKVQPRPLSAPRLVAVSPSLMALLDMHPSIAEGVQKADFVDFASGARVLQGSTLLSHRYGGHQFGFWADQLGDGRAITLGEYVNAKGERWELQFKGSGQTPYSRFADGRAVLRSSVREFLCSEHMHALGVPTSRALSLIVSDDTVVRDMFYSGQPRREKTAVVIRVAPTWFRIGSLEIHFYKKEHELLREVTNFVIENYFPTVTTDGDERLLDFFAEVVERTAQMIAAWMAVGFAHGVMNTDNFSLLGLTIDYGPFGFQEAFNPFLVPNTSDDEGRYAFYRQPDVGAENLKRMRTALVPLFTTPEKAAQMDRIVAQFDHLYTTSYVGWMRRKLGLLSRDAPDELVSSLCGRFLAMLLEGSADFTMSFRELSELSVAELATAAASSDASRTLFTARRDYWSLPRLVELRDWTPFLNAYVDAMRGVDEGERQTTMRGANPRYVLRNWMADAATRRANEGDFAEVARLVRVLTKPFETQQEAEEAGYARPPPDWANSLRVSCSS